MGPLRTREPYAEVDRRLFQHEIVTRAAEGDLPSWAVASDARRAHMRRVADLMGAWAEALELDESQQRRWRATANLHDALRDEAPDALRGRLAPLDRELPGPLLHGPAAAERLRIDGVLDGELLLAIAAHTTGDARLGALGRALYAADFLEPGRSRSPEWRAELRARMPAELDDVVFEIARARVGHRVERGDPLLARTVAFWNRLTGERG